MNGLRFSYFFRSINFASKAKINDIVSGPAGLWVIYLEK